MHRRIICNDTPWKRVPTIFPGHYLPDAARMTTRRRRMHCARKIITVSNTRAPKTTRSPIGVSLAGIPYWLVPEYFDRIFRAAWERRATRQADYRQESPNSKNYIKYKIFKISNAKHRSRRLNDKPIRKEN